MNDYVTIKFKICYSLYPIVQVFIYLYIDIRSDLQFEYFFYTFTSYNQYIIFDVYILYVKTRSFNDYFKPGCWYTSWGHVLQTENYLDMVFELPSRNRSH